MDIATSKHDLSAMNHLYLYSSKKHMNSEDNEMDLLDTEAC